MPHRVTVWCRCHRSQLATDEWQPGSRRETGINGDPAKLLLRLGIPVHEQRDRRVGAVEFRVDEVHGRPVSDPACPPKTHGTQQKIGQVDDATSDVARHPVAFES